ncbi:MAG: DUF4159 domain-containing protein [Alphaproteobacteria bacterium]|nr:DUF4159 domain-containing protein [Alphaproteobacteria bacterium]
MLSLGPLAFTAPWLLLGLFALPLLWWLLRLMPPAPRRIPFPAIRLLFGLKGEETTPKAAPWWLTILRLAIAALVVVTAARPVLNPDWSLTGAGPVVLVIDDGWSASPAWDARLARAEALLDTAERSDRPVFLILGAPPSDGEPLEAGRLLSAEAARRIVAALEPKPWPVDREAMTAAARRIAQEGASGDVFWLADGLHSERTADFAASLGQIGSPTVLIPDLSLGPMLIDPPPRGETVLSATLRRPAANAETRVAVVGYSEDGRPLLRQDVTLATGEAEKTVALDLPTELRNDLARLVLENRQGAGSAALLDERWSRRPIGIIADIGSREALPLLSEIYFLDRALKPLGQVDRGPTEILLRQQQSVLLLPDETVLETDDFGRLNEWIQAGGMLIRFAGPRLASEVDDPLVPVALRSGGRQLSGAMLWTEPARIGRVAEDGPFAGMEIPGDVAITRQVLAEPSLELDRKTWMRLADDTPLVTADRRGDGWLVLVHTTANTEWSDMAISGLFVDMLGRLSSMGRGVRDAAGDKGTAAPYRTLDGFGRLGEPQSSARPIHVDNLDILTVSPAAPPGFYGTQKVRVAVNLGDRVPALAPMVDIPGGTVTAGFEKQEERPLAPYLLLAALALLLFDTALTVVLRGYSLTGSRGVTTAVVMTLVLIGGGVDPAAAQDPVSEIPAGARDTVLAYVLTGDPQVDSVSAAGLRGLSDILRQRTAVETGDPVGVDIDSDELAFYPLLYWPVLEDVGTVSAPAADRLNRFMAGGGLILFDTRDGHLAGSRIMSGSGGLRRLAEQLNVPPLATVPPEHVLTRSFYLMQDFPGRWDGGTVWVETGASISNDGVSPVVVGDADWAAAWAIDELGRPMFPIGDDGRQREMAYRFGVNLVMYTLTGNYKADQVHIPSILERLGQ